MKLSCVLCHQPHSHYQFHEYGLRRDGVRISLCCYSCKKTFYALPENEQRLLIRQACDQALSAPQTIYSLADPLSPAYRYIGRTKNIKQRYTDHLHDISPKMGRVNELPWYGRKTWMYDLNQQGMQPIIQALHEVEIAPQVIEWERRYILHGIQQGWPLLNAQMAFPDLVQRVRASQLDFLHAPFEEVVAQGFFSSHGIMAFIRTWYTQDDTKGIDNFSQAREATLNG